MSSLDSTRWFVAASLVLPLMLCACAPDPADAPEPALSSVSQPVVGGSLESGWLGVGALTESIPGYGYGGSFCTGTLIAERWVLTAAHCLEGKSPSLVSFYVGSDARASYGGLPSSGTLYEVDLFIVHNNYSYDSDYDVGLVHLAEPATGVPSYPVNTEAMSGSWIGQDAFYVGFGVSDGVTLTGDGVKRSGTIPIYTYDALTYTGSFEGTGICFGDSGGPGLLQVGGQWRIIGINSAVGGAGGTVCQEYYIDIRADAMAGWIAQKMGSSLPTCQQQPSMCTCTAACRSNGTCDNSACQVLSCAQMSYCMNDCAAEDMGCIVDCYLTGTGQGQGEYDALMQCGEVKCSGLSGSSYQSCVETQCASYVSSCFTGAQSCEQIEVCMADCGNDMLCLTDCFSEGSAQAQQLWEAMQTCLEDSCGDVAQSQFATCAWEHCGVQIEGCYPPANCDLRGGDCAPGTACWPTPTGKTSCYDSQETALGQPCQELTTSKLGCVDGAACWETSTGSSTCLQLCLNEADCPDGQVCDGPIFDALAQVGLCSCEDGDQDGACQPADCDDANEAVFPGATESCDGIDNNCNELIDEGCPGVDAGVGGDLGVAVDSGVASGDSGGQPPEDPGDGGDDGCQLAPGQLPPGGAGTLLLWGLLALVSLLRRRR